jgi:hypothetical protein
MSILRPMIQKSAANYLTEKKLARRDCAKELTEAEAAPAKAPAKAAAKK